MIRKLFLSSLGALVFAFGGLAQADPIVFDYGFNIDGTVSMPILGDPVPAEVDLSSFDDLTGLGFIEIILSGAGAHYVAGFFDHEIDESINTFFNEFGTANGTAAAGQSWEIDEPGYLFGDIYDNFLGSTLEGINSVPAGSEDDVSMALGWDFDLLIDEIATIVFSIDNVAPESGFYLSHTDPDSDYSLYFSSALDVTGGGGTTVPEPGTLWLLGAGLLALGLSRRRITKH